MSYKIKSAGQVLKEKHGKTSKKKYEIGNLYNTARWRRFSRNFRMANPFCSAEGCDFLASDVDHIIPIKEGGPKWSENNLQSLCKSCHAKKSAEDRKKYK